MNATQNTTRTTLKEAQASRRWVEIDASKITLGRLATRASTLLRGKHKRFFSPDVDCGDFVVVTNAAKMLLTGAKLEQKTYFSHSGYAGGAKIMPMKLQLERDPRKIVYLAVKRMLPVNRLRDRQLTRLKIYPGAAHPHAAQIAVEASNNG